LSTGPAKASRGKSFIDKQISIPFKNKAFDPVCLCPAEQEQNIFLGRVQLKLLLYDCG